ncbi:MAG: AmmeMemoRadiSam system protein A [archaeon]
MLTKAQGNKLLKLAKKSIDSWFKKKQLNFANERKEFKEARGVFVTLNLGRKLRGCIGYPYPTLPLADAVFEGSRSAAFSDQRFDPLTEKEFKKVKIEVSVLTIPKQIQTKGNEIPKQVKIGKDGLIIQFQGHSGLLLPQVAKELKLNPISFLNAVCEKAGLPGNSWLNLQAKIYAFQAQVFKS